MGKRLGCAVLAALMLTAAARGQQTQGAPFTPPLPQPTDAVVAPVTVLPEENTGGLEPIAGLARTFAASEARIWISADYLFTFMRGMNVPALVTTSPAGTPRASAGVLGEPGTDILFGAGDRLDGDLRAGFQLAGGVWLNREQTLGVEAGFLMTSSEAALYSANSTNGTILARPFINADNNTKQAVLVAFPGSSTGSINVRAESGNLFGANVDLAENAYENSWFRLVTMIGYQFYGYDESLGVQQTINALPGSNFAAGTKLTSTDNFATRNYFNGLDLGLRSQFSLADNLYLELLTKVAVGKMQRIVDINGETVTSVPGAAPITRSGGVLALSPNSGSFSYTDWRAVPEVGVNFCWQVRPNIALRAGYSFIFLNDIARAGEQVDTTINPNLLPGANSALGGALRPAFNLTRTDMWVQSLSLGLEFTY